MSNNSPLQKVEFLNVLNQLAPREYVNFTKCFPFDNDKEQEAVSHLQRCVDDCVQQNPHLAGTIVSIPRTPQQDVLARTLVDPTGEHSRVIIDARWPSSFFTSGGNRVALNYGELRASGFSPGLFFDDVFAPMGDPAAAALAAGDDGESDSSSVPILLPRVVFIPGGLLLGVFMHHAMADGVVATALIDDLAARSRGVKRESLPRKGYLPKSQYLPLGQLSAALEQHRCDLHETQGLSSEETVTEILPEWTTITNATAFSNTAKINFSIKNSLPVNQSPRVGKIFHVSKARIEELRETLAQSANKPASKPPSTFVTLMALVWSYVAKARMRAVGVADWSALHERGKNKTSNTADDSNEGDMAAQSCVVAAWHPSIKGRGRGFSQETLDAIDDFCGNMAICPIATLPTTQLLWQAADSSPTQTDKGAHAQKEALAAIAAPLTQLINSLDADFIRQRPALLETLPDVGALAMNYDFEAPQNVFFNSHRYLAGADTEWDIPGLILDDNDDGDGTAAPEVAVAGGVASPRSSARAGRPGGRVPSW
ncbi:hypothetical protein PG999_012645 [Apiospora kogelbergensis]|uniref:Trichothecene 3-O-acetyltransferase-like N-terminal domain-containing protein n=1 Tax=Apiospora kogelbergensis TaxID=1337665 RepID=A0AAW0Q9W1_9PEZI